MDELYTLTPRALSFAEYAKAQPYHIVVVNTKTTSDKWMTLCHAYDGIRNIKLTGTSRVDRVTVECNSLELWSYDNVDHCDTIECDSFTGWNMIPVRITTYGSFVVRLETSHNDSVTITYEGVFFAGCYEFETNLFETFGTIHTAAQGSASSEEFLLWTEGFVGHTGSEDHRLQPEKIRSTLNVWTDDVQELHVNPVQQMDDIMREIRVSPLVPRKLYVDVFLADGLFRPNPAEPFWIEKRKKLVYTVNNDGSIEKLKEILSEHWDGLDFYCESTIDEPQTIKVRKEDLQTKAEIIERLHSIVESDREPKVYYSEDNATAFVNKNGFDFNSEWTYHTAAELVALPKSKAPKTLREHLGPIRTSRQS